MVMKLNQNYTITIFVRVGGRIDVMIWTFAVGAITKIEQVQTKEKKEFKFWSFYDNVNIECDDDIAEFGIFGLEKHHFQRANVQ